MGARSFWQALRKQAEASSDTTDSETARMRFSLDWRDAINRALTKSKR